MSFLQQMNFRDKALIAKKFFFEYFWIKTTLYVALASLFFSLVTIQFALPQFYVSATLREAQGNTGGAVNQAGGLIRFIGDDGDVFNEFRSNVYSYVIAQRMWEKGWGSQVFAGGNEEIDFNKIKRRHTISEKLGSFLLGYDLYDYYSAHDLQDFISGSISMDKEIKGTNITVSMMSSDQ